jgi:tetratricopeptide (TPR) repeat protein/predicted Ser/Thr protein kinase
VADGDTRTETADGDARPVRPPGRAIRAGDFLDRFVVLEQLGEGGMGVVYKAYDPQLDRRLALKLLREPDADGARLLREAQAIAQLTHRNVVAVYDLGRAGADVFIAMEFVDGQTLAAWLRQPRSRGEILDRFVEAGRGLAAGHRKGIVHRDFKPANVLVPTDGEVRVVDFGLARAHAVGDGDGDGDPRGAASALGLDLTGAAVVGTPRYMAPEQYAGGPVDPRTDQFAFCVALYEAVVGQPPFAGDDLATLRRRAEAGEVTPIPRSAAVPTWLERVLLRGLAVDPAARFASMDALLAAIERGRATPRRRALAALAVVAVAGLAALGLAFAHAGGPAFDGCTLAGDGVGAVWNSAARDAIGRAFAATGAADATDAARRVGTLLDRQAGKLRDARVTACRANRSGLQSDLVFERRSACFDRRLGELAAISRAMAASKNAKEVERAVQAAAALIDVSSCADVSALLARVPMPDDPAARSRINQTFDQLDELWAKERLARYDEVDAAIGPLREAADATGFAQLQAEVRALESAVARGAGKDQDAEAALHEMASLAAAAHDDAAIADAYAALIYVIGGDSGGRQKDALAILPFAEVAAARANDDAITIKMLRNSGIVYDLAGNFDEAQKREEKALAMQRDKFPDDRLGLARALMNLCALGNARGRDAEVIDQCRESLRLRQDELGPRHPEVIDSQINLAGTLVGLHRYDEAEPLFAAAAAAAGDGSLEAGVAELNLAELERRVDKNQAAIDHLERARAIFEKRLGPAHQYVGVALGLLGRNHLALGHLDEAETHLGQAIATLEAAVGPDHRELGFPLRGLAMVRRKQGRAREAIAIVDRALRVMGPEPADEHFDAEFERAQARWDAGERRPAVAAALAARAALEALPDDTAEVVAEIDEWLAEPARQGLVPR